MLRRTLLGASIIPIGIKAGLMTLNAKTTGDAGWPGQFPGMWHWRLGNTPNGLKPSQSWHAIGSTPDGSIYIGGMDHRTNSALFCIDSNDNLLRYVGDAKSASETVNNWMPNETAQKFHTRPTWHKEKVYVATLDDSNIDDSYLSDRGFHWYAYDEQDGFVDISAKEQDGVGAQHVGLVTLASDPMQNYIYGASIPTADIYRYDVSKQETVNIGRPQEFKEKYVYTNRIMWVDDESKLYITAGNPDYKDPKLDDYQYVYCYDPEKAKFIQLRDWKLVGGRALEVGQHLRHLGVSYFADDRGCIYRFEHNPIGWSCIGQPKLHDIHYTMWSFNVSSDGKTAYMITTCGPKYGRLFRVDLETATIQHSVAITDLGDEFKMLGTYTGYDSWDKKGRFYFASFSTDINNVRNVMITRIDPNIFKG